MITLPTWTKEQTDAIVLDGSNIIVSAGAGSGKTAVLSERVIYKLNKGIHIDELLILTFTRFSAEEMKDRIRKKIKKDPALKKELDALDSAYITTFDSFALSIVKKYHYLLNLGKDIEITDGSVVALEKKKIMDKVMETCYENITPEFENMIRKFCLKNDKSLRKSILTLANKIEGFINKENYIKNIKENFFTDENIEIILKELDAFITEKKNIISLELSNTSYYFDTDYTQKLEDIILPIVNSKTLDELTAFTNFKLPTVPRGTDDEAKKAKEALKKSLDELLSIGEYGTREKIKQDILNTKETILEIIKIIELYFQELENFKKNNNIFTFSDIANLAIKVLKENDSARLELKNKFKEIMIDEYQDTNDVQEIFINMIASDNVYMVGDVKQSIYRFRGSNPSIFKTKYDNYSENRGGRKIDLIKNFRSRGEVLNNINKIFDLIMDDDLGGAAYTVSHEMVFGNNTYLTSRDENFNYNFDCLEYIPLEDKEFSNIEIEIFTIAEDIKNKIKNRLKVFDKETGEMRDFRYSDAVIILDRSKYFDDFKKIFEYLEIPLTILKDDKLNASTDLYLIKNIFELIIDIHENIYDDKFKYAFLSVGRSFLYEYSDQELYDIITSKNYKNTKLYNDLANIENYNSMSIIDFLYFILDQTSFYEKLYKVGEYGKVNVRINKIIDLATNLGKLEYSILEFKNYLNDIIENDFEIQYTSFNDDVDSVKILTIHKSKGLEYPICYFADLDHLFNTNELKDKIICDSKYGIIIPTEEDSLENSDTIIKLLFKNTLLREEISEKIRLFYVALTRAREKIVLVLPTKETNKLEKNDTGTIELARRLKFKKLSDFIYAIKDYMPEYFKYVDLEMIGLTKNYLFNKSLENDLNLNTSDEFFVEEINIENEIIETKRFSKNLPNLLSQESRKNMEFGTRIHEILEHIDFKNFDPSSIEEDMFIKNKICNFIKSDFFKKIDEAKIYREFEFVYEENNTTYHGSIDLMLEYSDHIDIVDYKLLNTDDSHYIDQLHGYQNYINKISNKKTNIYLYSIIKETITSLN